MQSYVDLKIYFYYLAHEFNKSKFYEKFKKIVEKLNFEPIFLKQNLDIAASTIMLDRKHLDNNTKIITKEIVIKLLENINNKIYKTE